jgi:uncharacterized protein
MAARYEISKTSSGKFHFVLKAGNNEVILSSQQYADKTGAEGGIASCKKNGTVDANFERKTSKADEPYFVLKAGNGQIIGQSEMYKSAASCENGIASVMKNCGADVKDLTE